jgi:ATP-dependent DNA helicase RecG
MAMKRKNIGGGGSRPRGWAVESWVAEEQVLRGLGTSVRALKGVGPRIEKALKKRGIKAVEDLFCLLPLRYEDRRFVRPIDQVVEGEENVVAGRVVDSGGAYSRSTRRRLYHALVEDGTGTLTIKWFRFNKRWMTDICGKGNLLLLSGKVARYGADLQMIHPRVVVLKEGQDEGDLQPVVPVYPEIEGVTQGALQNIIKEAFDGFKSDLVSLIPERLCKTHGIPPLAGAFGRCHFPGNELPDEASRREDLSRIVLEEFFLFQLALSMRRGEMRRTRGVSMGPGVAYNRVESALSFQLTAGQERVLAEIARDMALAEPMNRLLQGDVGSGKTICAILAACIAVDSGCQVAFMAPTEILAEQHFLNIHAFLEQARVPHVLVTGNMGPGRRKIIEAIGRGETAVVVGTHAILQSDVAFKRLGLAVIDEQHRFGVVQRSTLKQKGVNPHVLVMSATPIPRSLSMVVYGDLDLSVIDDRPRGALKVLTKVVTDQEWRAVRDVILEQTGKGRQAFVVYPVLEESERIELRSAKESFQELQGVFPSLRIGLLHGKMKMEEKQSIMTAFRDGLLDILVCTTVVEVGIDVPNASLIVVEHAERFGLSQLHQLRGRVGRGEYPSRCILMSAETRTAGATKRLRILEKTADGFAIAEEDMKLRGAGDMLGARQAGIPAFRLGNIIRDGAIMSRARDIAAETIAMADGEELALLKTLVVWKWGERLHLGDVL